MSVNWFTFLKESKTALLESNKIQDVDTSTPESKGALVHERIEVLVNAFTRGPCHIGQLLLGNPKGTASHLAV